MSRDVRRIGWQNVYAPGAVHEVQQHVVNSRCDARGAIGDRGAACCKPVAASVLWLTRERAGGRAMDG
jgi:hypothetical protein